MADSGPMFGADTNFDPSVSYGTFVSDPDPSTADFYRSWSTNRPEYIIFQTGNRQATYECPYLDFKALMVLSEDFFRFVECTHTNGNGQVSTVNVNILMRPDVPEDPWIDVGGEHCSNSCSNILWGESGFPGDGPNGDHTVYKNSNGGVNVFIKGELPATPAPTGSPTYGPTSVPTVASSVITASATATQSSNLYCGNICSGKTLTDAEVGASRAIDGNTNGYYDGGSISHTWEQYDPWWEVRGISGPVSKIRVWNRLDTCCDSYLDGVIVDLLDANAAVLATQTMSGVQTTYTLDFGSVNEVDRVRVRREGYGPMMIAEVEVLGSSEQSLLSSASVASQSSNLLCGQCRSSQVYASAAIDGNTDGNFRRGSVTHTMAQVDPWLLVSLGLTATVTKIVIWNRTDSCCRERIVGGKVELLNSSNAVLHTETVTTNAVTTTFDINPVADVTAIRIRLETGYEYLALSVAELEAFGVVQS
jgi:hypothetical protein